MIDRIGVELKTGDTVKIEGAFFKNDNGYYYVESSPGDPTWSGSDYGLRKIRRNGMISTAKHSVAFWPLKAFTSNRAKNIEARIHNEHHATIEIVTDIDRTQIAAHFAEECEKNEKYAKRHAWDWGEDHPETVRIKGISEFYRQKAEEVLR